MDPNVTVPQPRRSTSRPDFRALPFQCCTPPSCTVHVSRSLSAPRTWRPRIQGRRISRQTDSRVVHCASPQQSHIHEAQQARRTRRCDRHCDAGAMGGRAEVRSRTAPCSDQTLAIARPRTTRPHRASPSTNRVRTATITLPPRQSADKWMRHMRMRSLRCSTRGADSSWNCAVRLCFALSATPTAPHPSSPRQQLINSTHTAH